MDNENSGYAMFKSIFEEQAEERRLQEAEMQIRYAARKAEKTEHRGQVEKAARKIFALIDAAEQKEDISANDIATLAAALNQAAMAMGAAENYAESRPFYSGMGGYCAV